MPGSVSAETSGTARPILRAREDRPTIQPAGRAEWREWLAANHRSSSGVWLVTWKSRTGQPTVVYEDAVEEALCFGWIDGMMNRVDDDRTMQYFAPRKPKTALSVTPGRSPPRSPAAPSPSPATTTINQTTKQPSSHITK